MSRNCCLCSNRVKIVYEPIGSKICLKIGVCEYCGLIQGLYDAEAYQIENDRQLTFGAKIRKLSCDAHYSEVRVGKGQMADLPFQYFSKFLDRKSITRVLDMRSARGEFARKALEYFNLDFIDCIEGDSYITESYKNESNIRLAIGKYYDQFRGEKYDLVYSCHSMEHYRDPLKYAKFLKCKVKKGRFLFLDIPNPEVIYDGVNFEEYFYDKHLIYFSRNVLIKFFESMGFQTLSVSPEDSSSLSCLFQLVNEEKQINISENYDEFLRNVKLLSFYKENLEKNRSKISNAVNKLAKFMSGKKSLAIGIGRLYDCFQVHSAVPLKFDTLVDNYLHKVMTDYDGQKIISIIEVTESPEICIIFTRRASKSLIRELSLRFGPIEIKHITEFL